MNLTKRTIADVEVLLEYNRSIQKKFYDMFAGDLNSALRNPDCLVIFNKFLELKDSNESIRRSMVVDWCQDRGTNKARNMVALLIDQGFLMVTYLSDDKRTMYLIPTEFFYETCAKLYNEPTKAVRKYFKQ